MLNYSVTLLFNCVVQLDLVKCKILLSYAIAEKQNGLDQNGDEDLVHRNEINMNVMRKKIALGRAGEFDQNKQSDGKLNGADDILVDYEINTNLFRKNNDLSVKNIEEKLDKENDTHRRTKRSQNGFVFMMREVILNQILPGRIDLKTVRNGDVFPRYESSVYYFFVMLHII